MFSKRLVRKSSILLIFVIQFLFLLAIVTENTSSIAIPMFIFLITVVLVLSFLKSPLHQHAFTFEKISIAIWVPIGAISSFLLNHEVGLGAVFAASLVGFCAAILPYCNKNSVYLNQISAAIYCGSFIGMSNTKVAQDIYFVLAAGICTGILLIISKSLMHGIGGKLGTLTFAGVAITYLILFLFAR